MAQCSLIDEKEDDNMTELKLRDRPACGGKAELKTIPVCGGQKKSRYVMVRCGRPYLDKQGEYELVDTPAAWFAVTDWNVRVDG